MKILLLCSSFNGLTQRVWVELRRAGHEVSWCVAEDDVLRATVDAVDPDLILCPFLRERVPDDVWQARRTVIIHPGPGGDRGPCSLDWAIGDGEETWGVTALSAIAEMDAGPVWATRSFPLPDEPPRKSALYAGAVTQAASELALEVAERAAQPDFVPEPLDPAEAPGRARPVMTQADRAFRWSDATAHVLRRIRAADGSPGVRAELAGTTVSVFDAHDGTADLDGSWPDGAGEPGSIVARRHGAVLVRTGDGAVWVGHARRVPGSTTGARVKLPATALLGDRIADVPEAPEENAGYREISYRRDGDVGVLTFDFYNGAMSTEQCHRLADALRAAAAEETRVLVVAGGAVFSNGIHLGVIEAHPEPATEAWRNITAIDDVCREIITCPQLVVAAVGGNAGAGGVMLALGADQVLLRGAVVLNPHYRTMGLFGSEYWTYVLPRRVGAHQAARLTEECLPIGAPEAVEIGLADALLPGDRATFDEAVLAHAQALAAHPDLPDWLAAKATARDRDERHRALETYRVRELAEMSRDIFDDRSGFAAARRAFVTKQPTAPRVADVRDRAPAPVG